MQITNSIYRSQNADANLIASGCVGIFWGILDAEKNLVLLADKTPIEHAEAYGENVTHPIGHYEFWDGLRRLGARALVEHGLPEKISWSEYEDFPRGRVIYSLNSKHFVIFADKRLQKRNFIEQLVAAFEIPNEKYVVRSDPHYSTRCDEAL